nr:tetratricopeptide repeat protein [Bacilli bacterium]
MLTFGTTRRRLGLVASLCAITLPLALSASAHTVAHPRLATGSAHTIVVGGNAFQGTKALHNYELIAKKNPKNALDQINAGVSAFQNSLPKLAIAYYEKAGHLEPKNGLVWNNIGNVYRNSLHQDKTAINYYQKAISVQPSYDFGWLNWAYTLNEMNQPAQAKAVIHRALRVLPKSDPLYKPLEQMLHPQMPSTKPTTPAKKPAVSKVPISHLMTKVITSPIPGVLFVATIGQHVTSVNVIDTTQKKVHAIGVHPNVFTQGLFLLEAHKGDHVTLIPFVSGKADNKAAWSIVVK